MNVIEYNDKQKNEWNKFIAENKSECFLQSWQWGEFQKGTGKKVWRIAVLEEDKILAIAQIIKHSVSFLGNYLYCPRGPVVSESKNKNEKIEISEYLFNEIKKIAEEEKSIFLKAEPAIGSNYGLLITDYGLPKGFRKSNTEFQPKNTLMIDLAKPEGELLAGMKQKTRYNIRLAEKKGVKIRISSDLAGDFPKFWNLIEETSRRNGITPHSGKYYSSMLESLKENADVKQNKLFSRLYLAEYDGKIIASNIVLFFSDFAVYLHGASSDEHKNVMAPYLLQWKQILDAKELGCRKYDFWGITVDGEKESWKGITRFKKGFGGFEKKYIGSLDMPYDKMKYFGYGVIRKVRKIFRP